MGGDGCFAQQCVFISVKMMELQNQAYNLSTTQLGVN